MVYILTALACLVLHKTAAVSARSVYTIQPCTMSFDAKPHVCMVPECLAVTWTPALLAEWPGCFTCYCGNTEEERIPK